MASIPLAVNLLLWANLLLLAALCIYLVSKLTRHKSVPFLISSLAPLLIFEAGSQIFLHFPTSRLGAQLIVLGLAFLPIGFGLLSQTLGRRSSGKTYTLPWIVYYVCQILILAFFAKSIFLGQIIEWVTGILDQPVILIDKRYQLLFVNVLVSCAAALLCFDATLRKVANSKLEALKLIFIAFLGLIAYFSYACIDILTSSYISQPLLFAGAVVIFFALSLLTYSFAKYPFWEINISVSRRIVFGCLSASALIIYLAISGTIFDLLSTVRPHRLDMLLPFTGFLFVAGLLAFYLSPSVKTTTASFIARNFFRNKYDYRDVWMKFSQRSGGSLNLKDLLPKITELIADAMFVRQVAVWLRSGNSESFALAHCFDFVPVNGRSLTLRLNRQLNTNNCFTIYQVPTTEALRSSGDFPFDGMEALRQLAITRLVAVTNGSEILALLGIGDQLGGKQTALEDERFLLSISNQIAHLIVKHTLSEDLLLSREWESFNRFASFVVHDLKNLATMQAMTLENAKRFSDNPEFIADAFAAFQQTTDKMINLIASLSVQRGQFSLKQQPVNILEVIASTFEDLKLDQRNGLKIVTAFPPKETIPIISGDRELLQKAFTNLLLNAIQSLPKGQGAVEVTVSEPHKGRITAAIKDTGCGISSEQLNSLFRPFQTTKRQGTGIGLCHTRSIIEVHGGQIRIESQVDAGTKVEVELPAV